MFSVKRCLEWLSVGVVLAVLLMFLSASFKSCSTKDTVSVTKRDTVIVHDTTKIFVGHDSIQIREKIKVVKVIDKVVDLDTIYKNAPDTTNCYYFQKVWNENYVKLQVCSKYIPKVDTTVTFDLTYFIKNDTVSVYDTTRIVTSQLKMPVKRGIALFGGGLVLGASVLGLALLIAK